ncbi:hypothetical protein B4U80_14093 [Leptotrombidium deliense]|uniref:BPTI/Kunitz inhibitor domain-containing protein n=1 Tax=Leptotrombidium deliense TaxID=299467 RepID=A0A443S2W4_9ACAR|nr:hypothetical protein B4U80_14093 [Leptotrombidium deliense]
MKLTFVFSIIALMTLNLVFADDEDDDKDPRCTGNIKIGKCFFRFLPSFYYDIKTKKCVELESGKCVKQSLLGGLLKPKDFVFLEQCQSKCETDDEEATTTAKPETTTVTTGTTPPQTTTVKTGTTPPPK